mgnify:CR=1 FL=1
MIYNKIVFKNFSTKYGQLLIGSFDDKLCICDWYYRKMRNNIDQRIQRILKAEYAAGTSNVIENTISQLEEYFRKERKIFDIPLVFAGTEFQKKVWNELIKIPYSQTLTYIQLAETLGDKSAIRAVATANGANAISIIVPCHRIIGKSGELVGYAGGLKAKRDLLELENEDKGLFE